MGGRAGMGQGRVERRQRRELKTEEEEGGRRKRRRRRLYILVEVVPSPEFIATA